ncbi:CDP-alcohol phosphatidyltransferase family protein [Aeromicrobium duanguangcaii]|uniref:CDP-alcohol phosphatidyltransferase family protein n=1 Tax=Aeromicrobium duanguangcaii TaxID=2968086 RepID=A0ABY5KI39_9ACTN|nr:CDP-alcohol phosphatidyltransferase family protein [Aeromicrobium duanguangcaii]MCD9153791.1 CDP-alcohol phosphatidyltransferase family protein [Aeromicrobium duanguangcaii]UUI69131.1 CDP-alcohol phosphatidyltransferase family protein [Aeromicrobium duanguangcaii]
MTSERQSFRFGLADLRAAQKPARGTPAYSRHVNRPLGRIVAAWCNSHGMRPNQATAISATLSASAITLLATVRPTWWLGLLIAFLLAAGYVMDSVDGQLARLRGGGSLAGEWLDHTVDCFKTLTLHLAVAVSWFRFADLPHDAWLLVPLGFTVVAAAMFFGLMLIPTLRPAAISAPTEPAPPEGPLRRFLILPTDYGFQCWAFALLGWTVGFRVLWTVTFVGCAALLALALRKWWRELRALDAGVA